MKDLNVKKDFKDALAQIISMMSKWDITIEDLRIEYNRILGNSSR